jgi:hypothetical protein
MPRCPSCGRPVALARETCLYCGAALPADLVPVPPPPGEPRAAGPAAGEAPPSAPGDRVLLVIDLGGAAPDALARALGLSAYEAALRARRGGFHLHAILGEPAATKERLRLEAESLRVDALPEAEARARPLCTSGGEREGERLRLRTEKGEVSLGREDLLLVVSGPIARQYQTLYRPRRQALATLDEGYRVHLHRRALVRPLEIDAANFEFGFAVTGSARLELEAWLEAVAKGVPRDDDFRRLPPAFGVAEPEPGGALGAAGRLAGTVRGPRGSDVERLMLDNAEQFRFYSGWRAAIERRRAALVRP